MKTNARVTTMVMVMCLAVVLVLTGGCKHKKQQAINPELTTQKTDTSGGGLPTASPENIQWTPATDMQKIYFDYNSFALRPDALKALSDNAGKMKAEKANMCFQVEGHCDERGTQEYNMALGEKRALAIRDHLVKLGVAGDRIYTISYGKERPVAQGHDEGAWKQNRRGEFDKGTK